MINRLIVNNKYLVILSSFLILIISSALTYFYIDRYAKKEKSVDEKSLDIERLRSLPYVSYVVDNPNPEKKGVTLYNRNLSCKGINIYTPYGMKEAYLMDMRGKILHTWSSKTPHGWQHVELDDYGNLFVIEGETVNINKTSVKLDWDSNTQWVSKNNHHHDLSISSNGDIYALTKSKRYISYASQTIPILDNAITVLAPDGKVKSSISIYDLLASEKMLPKGKLIKIIKKIKNKSQKKGRRLKMSIKLGFDIFHTNTIEVIERDIGVAKKGDILICVNRLNLIVIVDIERKKVIWTWGPGIIDKVHMPTVLENGNILIFDNGKNRGYSRVIELNPITEKIEWEYKSDPPELFFSSSRGSAQKLSNNNVLITECNKGHVFEVTKDGKIVWDFYNPAKDKETNRRLAIYRMMRITDPENHHKLKGLK